MLRGTHLDAAGAQRQLLTYTVALGYDATLPVEELRVFYRTLNDDLAAALRQYPAASPASPRFPPPTRRGPSTR